MLAEGTELTRLRPLEAVSPISHEPVGALTIWLGEEPEKAYALLLDGQVWEATPRASRPVMSFAAVRPNCAARSDTCSLRWTKMQILRADLSTRETQRKRLGRAAGRDGREGSACAPRYRARGG